MSAIVHFLVPGRIDQRTGGYIYDNRIVVGLRALGRDVRVHELAGRFPKKDRTAADAVATAATSFDTRDVVVIDSLCLGAAADVLPHLVRKTCRCIALIHHPASLEDCSGGPDEELLSEEKEAMRYVHRCVVTSVSTARLVQDLFEFPSERMGVVAPGVDSGALSMAPASGLPTRLLNVGTVSRRKDQVTLVRALGQVKDLAWSLDCYGSLEREPAAMQDLRSEIASHDLSRRVALRGEVGEAALRDAYRQAHLFVMSSRFEGFGMVLTEALSHGVPIVATDAGPTADILADGAGVVVPPGRPEGLAVALRRVLTERDFYAELRLGVRRAAGRLMGWDETVKRFAAQLDQAVG